MREKQLKKRILAVILSTAILVSTNALPINSMAAETGMSEEEIEISEVDEEAEEQGTAEEVDEETGKQGTAETGEAMETGTAVYDSVLCSGVCGENLTWELTSDGVLTISGTGDMYSSSVEEGGIWKQYASSITSVVMEEGVTSIGQYAFAGCENLMSLNLPASVESVGHWAFLGCANLTLYIPADSKLTTIGSVAAELVGMKEIVIAEGNPNFVSQNGVLFEYDLNHILLELVKYPAGKSDTFYAIPETIWGVSDYAFYGAKNLKEIEIPFDLQSIGWYAFAGCSSLQTMNFPETIHYIYSYAFSDCTELKEIYFYGDAPELYPDAFLNDTLTAYYPAGNATWTEDVMQNYGGMITWKEWTPVIDEGSGSESGDDSTVTEPGSFDASFSTSFDSDYLNSIGRYVFALHVSNAADEQLKELIEIFKSGNTYINDLDAQNGLIWSPIWVADSEEEIYQYCADKFTDLDSQAFMTRADWTTLRSLFAEYNEAKAAYDSETAFAEAKRVLQEIINMPVKLEDREAPSVLPDQAVTGETGTIETDTGVKVDVTLVSEEIPEDAGYHSDVTAIIAGSASGYTLTEVRNIRLVRTDNGAYVPVNDRITILITYPEGYDEKNDYLVYHNTVDGWEKVEILEKTADGLVCRASSLSPFAVAVKTSEPAIVKGDVNMDGQVALQDLMMCLYHISGRSVLTGDALVSADVNGDGSITVADLMKLLYYVSGRNTEL